MREIDVHPAPGLPQIDGDKPDNQSDRRQHLEIDDRFESDAPDPRHIRHARDAVNHRAKDDWRDQHADQLDEGVSERLHAHAEAWIELAQKDPHNHRERERTPRAACTSASSGRIFLERQ